MRVVKKSASDGIAYCEDPNPTPEQFDKAVERSKKKGFVLLPKRWVVERTNGWMVAQRKLRVVVDYASHCIRGWNWLTMMDILIRRPSGQKPNLIISDEFRSPLRCRSWAKTGQKRLERTDYHYARASLLCLLDSRKYPRSRATTTLETETFGPCRSECALGRCRTRLGTKTAPIGPVPPRDW